MSLMKRRLGAPPGPSLVLPCSKPFLQKVAHAAARPVRTSRKHDRLLYMASSMQADVGYVPLQQEPSPMPMAVDEAQHLPLQPALAPAAPDEAERKQRLWKAAIKLPMYSVGYIPVLVGAAAVFLQTGFAALQGLAGFMVAAVFVIAWLNLSNDAFDADTGVDDTKPESVVNLTGNRTAVALAAVAFFAAGVGLLAVLITQTGDPRPAAMLAFSIACGYVYQGPPFRLSYKGLGEPLCFLAFGPSATTAFYLAMLPSASSTTAAATAVAGTTTAAAGASTSTAVTAVSSAVGTISQWVSSIPGSVWACSVLVGISTTLILLTSHFHQIEGDRRAGKMSPLVRMGVERGLQVLKLGVACTYALMIGAVCEGVLPWAVLPVTVVSLPAARDMLAYANDHYRVPAKIALLKKFACMWHIAFGCSLAGGMVAARMLMT